MHYKRSVMSSTFFYTYWCNYSSRSTYSEFVSTVCWKEVCYVIVAHISFSAGLLHFAGRAEQYIRGWKQPRKRQGTNSVTLVTVCFLY